MPYLGRFRTPQKRLEHFLDHGAEVGAVDEIMYEQLADAFLSQPVDPVNRPELCECVRDNGEMFRYNIKTEEFGNVSSNGYIRTYFKPDPRIHDFPTNYHYYAHWCQQ